MSLHRKRKAPSDEPVLTEPSRVPAPLVVSAGMVSPATWAAFHARALIGVAGQLVRAPVTTLLAAAVIGIALALPVGLYLIVDALTGLTERWDHGAQISVFLKPAVGDAETPGIARELESYSQVESVRVLTRSEVLRDFEVITGLSGMVAAFGSDNPLPPVLVVAAHGRLTDPATRPALQSLAAQLRAHGSVDFVEFDTEWLARTQAALAVMRRAVSTFAIILGVSLLLVVSNLVRIMVDRQREEIAVSRLCGATDSFIKRPFVYCGLLLGLAGAVVGWVILNLAAAAMSGPLESLIALYPGTSEVPAPGSGTLASLGLMGGGIGWLGAWLAASYQLRTVEP